MDIIVNFDNTTSATDMEMNICLQLHGDLSIMALGELRVNTLKDANGNNSIATSVLFGGSKRG